MHFEMTFTHMNNLKKLSCSESLCWEHFGQRVTTRQIQQGVHQSKDDPTRIW